MICLRQMGGFSPPLAISTYFTATMPCLQMRIQIEKRERPIIGSLSMNAVYFLVSRLTGGYALFAVTATGAFFSAGVLNRFITSQYTVRNTTTRNVPA